MLPYIFKIGSLQISTAGFFAGLAFLFATFIFWKQLKDDYDQEELLSFIIYFSLFCFIGARLTYILENFNQFNFSISSWLMWYRNPGFSLLGGIIAGSVCYQYWINKRKWDYWLVLDKLMPSILIFYLFLNLGLLISFPNNILVYRLLSNLILLVISLYLLKNYRHFLWYKSGKVGFAGIISLALFLLFSFLLEIINANKIYLNNILMLAMFIIALAVFIKRSELKININFRNKNEK